MIAADAARTRSRSKAQFKTYCIFTDINAENDEAWKAIVLFGMVEKTSLSMNTNKVYRQDIWLNFDMYVVDTAISIAGDGG